MAKTIMEHMAWVVMLPRRKRSRFVAFVGADERTERVDLIDDQRAVFHTRREARKAMAMLRRMGYHPEMVRARISVREVSA